MTKALSALVAGNPILFMTLDGLVIRRADVRVTQVRLKVPPSAVFVTARAGIDYTTTITGNQALISPIIPGGGPYQIEVDYTYRDAESLEVTSISGNQLTVDRGIFTDALPWPDGALVVQTSGPDAITFYNKIEAWSGGLPVFKRQPVSDTASSTNRIDAFFAGMAVFQDIDTGGFTGYDGGYINVPGSIRASAIDPLGGAPEERVVLTPSDRVNIRVTTSYTDAYSAWDATPWDTSPWDDLLVTLADYEENITVNQDLPKVNSFSELLPTSEDIVVLHDAQLVRATNPRTHVSSASVDYGFGFVAKVLGVDYTITSESEVLFARPALQFFTGDGATTSFVVGGGGGVDMVTINGGLVARGTDYTVVDNDVIEFVAAPPPFSVIQVEPRPHVYPGAVVKLRFSSFEMLGSQFVITSSPTSAILDWDDGHMVTFRTEPPAGESLAVTYRAPIRLASARRAQYSLHGLEVDEFVPNIFVYDEGASFDHTRRTGQLVVDSHDQVMYQFTGLASSQRYIPVGNVNTYTNYWDRRNMRAWSWTGTHWVQEYEAGDDTQKIPAMKFPRGGAGLTNGAWTLGNIDGAFDDFPEAWQIRHAPTPFPPDYVGAWWAVDHCLRTMNGSAVSQWNDCSRFDQHAVQPSALAQPVYHTDYSATGLPAMVFSPATQMFMTGAAHFQTDNIWDDGGYLIVALHPANAPAGPSYVALDKGSEWSLGLTSVGGGLEVELTVSFSGTPGVWRTADLAAALDKTLVIEVAYSSNRVGNVPVIRVNGVTKVVTTETPPVGLRTTGTLTPITIGNDSAQLLGFDGGIGEIVLFTKIPNVLDINSFASYLVNKWVDVQNREIELFDILLDNGDLLVDEFGNLIVGD